MTEAAEQVRPGRRDDRGPDEIRDSVDAGPDDHLRVLRVRPPDDDLVHTHPPVDRLVLVPPGDHDLPAAVEVVESVAIHMSVLRRVARATTGAERLRIPSGPCAAEGSALARYWTSAAAHARAAAAIPGVDAGSIVRTTAEESLAAATIAVFGLAPVDPVIADAPVTVRRAVAFMEEHAGEPITIADVAAAAHMSVRGLQSAFRRALGTTPLEYLRRFRLRSAHADLVAGDPSRGDSVATIAARWGLMHAGRFSQRYREVFGESPMTTLQR